MLRSIPFFMVLAFVVDSSAAQYVNPDVLSEINAISVDASMVENKQGQCLPLEDAVKAGAESALRQAEFTVRDSAPGALRFSALAIYPDGSCVVSFNIDVVHWIYRGNVAMTIGLSDGGMFSRSTGTSSKEEVLMVLEDAVEMIAGEFLKAKQE